jgi:hypothetical protein
MLYLAERFNRRLVVAIAVLVSPLPIYARPTGGSDSGGQFVVLLIIMVVCFGLLNAIRKRLKNRKKQSRIPTAEKIRQPPSSEAARSIFVSYRRQDSPHITGRIYDELSTQFGKSAVFKDVDSMPLGRDFRDHIREQVRHCCVLIAVIGQYWNKSASGTYRLNDKGDHLRIEIETALERQIPVIPVLVDGMEMPSEEELPESLARLAYHHGISIRPDPDFHNDTDRLVRGIRPLLK